MQYDLILTNYSFQIRSYSKVLAGWRLVLPHSFGRHNSIHSSWLSGFQLLEFRDPDPRMRKLCWVIFTETLWGNIKEREDSLCPSELRIKVQTWFSSFKNTVRCWPVIMGYMHLNMALLLQPWEDSLEGLGHRNPHESPTNVQAFFPTELASLQVTSWDPEVCG